LIELPSDDVTPDQRKFQYGSAFNPGGPLTNFNNRGQRINRFYQTLRPYYVKQDPTDTTLIFESRFESGNLRRAVQIGEYEYDLMLKYDYGTSNYT
jgi:hypothetical protein